MAASLIPALLTPSSPSCRVQVRGFVSGVALRPNQSHQQQQQWLMRSSGMRRHWNIFRVSAESTEAEVDLDAPPQAVDDAQVAPEEETGQETVQEETDGDELVMTLKAEGSMPELSIPTVQTSLEALENVSDVRITTFEGLTAISLTKKTIIQATNVASEIVDTMEKSGFRMHTLNLAIDDE